MWLYRYWCDRFHSHGEAEGAVQWRYRKEKNCGRQTNAAYVEMVLSPSFYQSKMKPRFQNCDDNRGRHYCLSRVMYASTQSRWTCLWDYVIWWRKANFSRAHRSFHWLLECARILALIPAKNKFSHRLSLWFDYELRAALNYKNLITLNLHHFWFEVVLRWDGLIQDGLFGIWTRLCKFSWYVKQANSTGQFAPSPRVFGNFA